jgi:hypothetical protein
MTKAEIENTWLQFIGILLVGAVVLHFVIKYW